MENDPAGYSKETAEIFADPFGYVVDVHIENIKKDENTVDVKKEYILGLETILVRQDVSTAPSIFVKIKDCVSLLEVPEVEEEVCAFLGHISQNVQPVAKEIVKCQILSKCMGVYEKKPETINKIVFLLIVLNNTLKDFAGELLSANEDPAILKTISTADSDINEKTKERLSALLAALKIK